MPSTDIGAGLSLADSILKALTPRLNEALAQQYDREAAERIQKFEALLLGNNPDQLHAAFDQLLRDAGNPAGPVGTTSVEIPLVYLWAAIESICKGIRDTKKLASTQWSFDHQ